MYSNNLDPDILAIISGKAFEGEITQDAIKAPEPPQPVRYMQQETAFMNNGVINNMSSYNEVAEQTNSLDSQGNILKVGDKVVVGNDKAVGRIVKLGKVATVSLQDEGTFEFPCTVLTLYSKQAQVFQESRNIQQSQYSSIQDTQPQPLQHTGKFESYTMESLMSSRIAEADINDTNESLQDITNRLAQANDGQPFNMGIN